MSNHEGSPLSLEVWMRGPIVGVPALLQPVAHALLQADEEIKAALNGFDDSLLWEKPYGMASVAFHLQHIYGVIERMFTYADGLPLSDRQLDYLQNEGVESTDAATNSLVNAISDRITKAVEQLKAIDGAELTDTRFLGRKRIPTTLIGLLFHAAEHTQRHIGQLLVTVRVITVRGG